MKNQTQKYEPVRVSLRDLCALCVKHPRMSASAFTLLEMLAVMSIVSIMMLAAVFNFTSFGSGEKIRTSVIQLKGTLVSARQTAITKRARTSLIYSNDLTTLPPRGLYWTVRTNSVGQPEQMLGDTNFLAPGLLFTESPGRIVFRTDGSCPGSAAKYITVTEQMKIAAGGSGMSNSIRIYPLTGQTKVID